MKILIFLLFLFPLSSSCGIILINENNYRALKERDKKSIKPYDYNFSQTLRKEEEEVVVYEINSADIKEYLKHSKYTWIHLWRPFCKAEICQNINAFAELEKEYQHIGLHLLFVSETYDMASIQKVVQNTGFKKNIFVLQDAYYGHKTRKNKVALLKEFNHGKFEATKYGVDDLLFKDTNLIFAEYHLSKKQIDSLIALSDH